MIARAIGAVAAALLGSLALASAAAAEVRPFAGSLVNGAAGLSCEREQGVRFCEGGPTGFRPADDFRVESFDGQRLDADVTLPAAGDGPFPVAVMLHGLGENKAAFEKGTTTAATKPYVRAGLNNVDLARKGYAVVNYTARGWYGSCGSNVSDPQGGKATCPYGSWMHLADIRYEIRDTQYLAGLLVDQGIARPSFAVIGLSYGGGQTLALAQLRDRIVPPHAARPNDTRPLRSPDGTPMAVGGAFALWAWSDLTYALMPNGRLSVDEPGGLTTATSPVGVMNRDFEKTFFRSSLIVGQVSPKGVQPSSDMIEWNRRMAIQGEPYDDVQSRYIVNELRDFHSSAAVAGPPAPTVIANGWNDELFPAPQAVDFWNLARQSGPSKLAMMIADIGHSRGQNRYRDVRNVTTRGIAWLDRYVNPAAGASAAGSVPRGVTAWTTRCPGASLPNPVQAASFGALSKGEAVFGSGRRLGPRHVNAIGGRRSLDFDTAPDPSGASNNICEALTAKQRRVGVASWRLRRVRRGYSLLGAPTVTARIRTTRGNPDGELVARLWDVSAAGQVFVTEGVYRLVGNQRGRITIQMNGNFWRFQRGHRLRVEILGADRPTYRRSNNRRFRVSIKHARLTLPTKQSPRP